MGNDYQEARLALSVLPEQRRFIESTNRETAYIGGVGAGKTRASVYKALSMPPGSTGMFIAPTYGMLEFTLIRTMLEVAEPLIRKYDKAKQHMILMNGTEIIYRSADNPEKLRGANLGWAGLDEAALMSRETLDIILGRLRLQPEKMWFTTTPKGKRHWLYRYLVEGDAEIIRTSSLKNPYLSVSYLESLKKRYTSQFYEQEVLAKFVDEGGVLFHDAHYYDKSSLPTSGYRLAIGFDAAYTAKQSADYSVILVGRYADEKLYLTHFYRKQVEPAMLVQDLNRFQNIHKARLYTRIGSTEKVLIAWLQNQGLKVDAEITKGDKYTNAQGAARAWNDGRVLIPRNEEWTEELLDEVQTFTGNKDPHDDVVDALVTLFRSFNIQPIRMVKF